MIHVLRISSPPINDPTGIHPKIPSRHVSISIEHSIVLDVGVGRKVKSRDVNACDLSRIQVYDFNDISNTVNADVYILVIVIDVHGQPVK